MDGSSGVKSDEISKLDMRLLISSANENPTVSQGMNNVERRPTTKVFKAHGEDVRKTSMDVIYGDESACRTTLEVIDVIGGKHDTWGKAVGDSGHGEGIVASDASDDEEYDSLFAKMVEQRSDGVAPLYTLPKTRHRDGSIYKSTHPWRKQYHIADRKETCLEAMMLTEPPGCFYFNGFCLRHAPSHMFQIFSLKLAEITVDDGLVQLYGYIAVRDHLDPLRNYVVNFTRDAPITVEKGSLISMTGPKRGIDFRDDIVIEYDMRIKTGEEEKHDLSLIDGASVIGNVDASNAHARAKRILGSGGAIDITVSRIEHAVEATVEVLISEVQRGFNLCLGCFTSDLNEEIQLFDGAIGEARCLKRSVVAVAVRSWLVLKFKVGPESSSSAEHCCSFRANSHGLGTQKINTGSALISVNVTWSPLPCGASKFF